jgi:dCMP deaminase
MKDDLPERQLRPLKYRYFVHAEMNAILNAARIGVATEGCTLYVSDWAPCSSCCRAIIQAGIVRVVHGVADTPERWLEDMSIGRGMLLEAGVKIDAL